MPQEEKREENAWRCSIAKIKTFQRVTAKEDFRKLYTNATVKIHVDYIVLFYVKSSEQKVAFIAGKKVDARATRRNLAKRMMRAIFVELSDSLSPGIYLWVAKKPILNAKYDTIKDDVIAKLKKRSLLHHKG